MHILSLVLLLASFFHPILALQNLHIKAWPFSSSPTHYATITYDESTSSATLDDYTPYLPPSETTHPLVRLGFFTSAPETESSWIGIAVPVSDFAETRNKSLRLWTTGPGTSVERIGFVSLEVKDVKSAKDKKKIKAAAKKKGAKKGGETGSEDELERRPALGLEVRHPIIASGPVYNKPIVLNQDGQVEQAPEQKSFLQKYWWVIGLFLLTQVVLGGRGEEEAKK